MRYEKCGIMVINCPWLSLALKPEPPGGAPQGYSQALALWTLVDAAAGTVENVPVLDACFDSGLY